MNDHIPTTFSMFYGKGTSKNWHENEAYNRIFLDSMMYYYNARLEVGRFVTVNDVLDGLGLERTTDGMVYGWTKDERINFGFDFPTDESKPIAIAFVATNLFDRFKEEGAIKWQRQSGR